jgi:hypothetical protein
MTFESFNQKDDPMNRGFAIQETTIFDPATGVTLEFSGVASDTSKCKMRLTLPNGDRLDGLFDRGGLVISVTSFPATADPAVTPVEGTKLEMGSRAPQGVSVVNTTASLLSHQPNVQARPDQGNASQVLSVDPRTPVDHNAGLQSLQNAQNVAVSRGEIGPLDEGFDHANPGQPHPDRQGAFDRVHGVEQNDVVSPGDNPSFPEVLPNTARTSLPNAPQSSPPKKDKFSPQEDG